MDTTSTIAIDEALANFRQMMASDGYTLSWRVVDDTAVEVQLEAGPTACADCLSPPPVIEAIIGAALASTPYRVDRVIVPADDGGSDSR